MTRLAPSADTDIIAAWAQSPAAGRASRKDSRSTEEIERESVTVYE
jgi:hypothetical protein